MKKTLLILCSFYLFISYNHAQVNAEIIGKTITDSLVITDGASTGFILQSADATGLGEWVNPGIFGIPDNLGSHSATTDLIMNGSGIEQVNHLEFVSGAIMNDDGAMGLKFSGTQIDFTGAQLLKASSVGFVTGATFGDDGAMGLEYSGAQIDFGGAQLERARSLSFALSGGDSYIREVASGGGTTPTEIHLWSNSMNPVPVGIGGPVNPVGGTIATVLTNAGVLPTTPPFFMLGVHGDAWATDWYAISDARFKKNISPIQSSLNKVKRMEAVTYNLDKEKFENGEIDESKTIGFLAQDLAEIVPEAVKVNASGVHLVRYNALIPILAQAISELDEKIVENDVLKSEVNQLKNRSMDMLKRIEQLEMKANQN